MRKVTPLGLLAALAIGTSVSAQDPAALVVRIQGDVDVRHGTAAPTPASVGEQIFVGDGVLPEAGARAILITRSGAQQVVTEETTISEPRGGGNPDIFARAVATLARAASTDASMGGRQGMVRPIPAKASLMSPRNELSVSSTRPTFVWTSDQPGRTFDLQLRKADGGRPMIFELGADTTWTLPESEAELEHGAEYVWTIFPGGRRTGRNLPEQRFRVISLVESVEMEDYIEQISVFGLDPMGDGLFLTVVAYRDMELFYDANSALDAVESQTTLSPELYMLKGEILAEMGWEAAARAAFDRADELMR